MKAILGEIFKDIIIGDPVNAGPLQLFSLHNKIQDTDQYSYLNKAFTESKIDFTEVYQDNAVRGLKLLNKSEFPVLMIAGEMISGSENNWLITNNCIINPFSENLVPVTIIKNDPGCSNTLSKKTSRHIAQSSLRKSWTLSKSFRETAEEQSNINHSLKLNLTSIDDLHTKSNDGFSDRISGYDKLEKMLSPLLISIQIPDNCNGMVFAHNDKIIGFQYFKSQQLFHVFAKKVIFSYLVDVFESTYKNNADYKEQYSNYLHQLARKYIKNLQVFDSQKVIKYNISKFQVKNWLNSISEADLQVYKTFTNSENFRISSNNFSGYGLVSNNTLVHAEIFNIEQTGPSFNRLPNTIEPTLNAERLVVFPTTPVLQQIVLEIAEFINKTLGCSSDLIHVDDELTGLFDKNFENFTTFNEETDIIRPAIDKFPLADRRIVLLYRAQKPEKLTLHYKDKHVLLVYLDEPQTGDIRKAISIIARNILIQGLLASHPQITTGMLLHGKKQGCILDLAHKSFSSAIKMKTKDLCPLCSETIKNFSLSGEGIIEILNYISKVENNCIPPKKNKNDHVYNMVELN